MVTHPTLVAVFAAMTPAAGVLAADYVPIAVAAVAGIPALLAVVLSHRRAGKKIEQIHILVNSRLSQALDEIEDLKGLLVRKDEVIAQQVKNND